MRGEIFESDPILLIMVLLLRHTLAYAFNPQMRQVANCAKKDNGLMPRGTAVNHCLDVTLPEAG